jgi:hypothetical protein
MEWHADPDKLAEALNSMTHTERVQVTRAMSGLAIERLFDTVIGHSLDPEYFLTFDITPHAGTNNMLVARAFQKIFYRTTSGIAGRNAHRFDWLTGPGYFSVKKNDHAADVIFDYSDLPQQCPARWPTITDNARGVSYFVYRGLTDVMRKVSEHVSVGRAFRFGKPLPNYFVLVRQA